VLSTADQKGMHTPAFTHPQGGLDELDGSCHDQHASESDAKHLLLQLIAGQGGDLVAHLAQVAALAEETATILGLPEDDVRLTRLGAELHDIGMVGIPAAIVEKTETLSGEEQWFLQRHSEIGEAILTATPALAAVAPIVRSIHERPDGMGYPDGLTLEQIPLASRVIAVVEAFDTMTHDQPYQRATSEAHALAELRRHAGTQFDAYIVEAFATTIARRHRTFFARSGG
jgi:HD-GYP domain-containing protein (c-di-GMP phosphodiesterase class II)